jgi:DNA repair exonuclease SbcCD nuclease subunit
MQTKKDLVSICEILGIPNTKTKTKNQLKELIKKNTETKKTTVIKSGGTTKYIYHSADIHIRILERHQEYKKVFEELINYISLQENLSESVFVISGDIFHCRDKMVSETILLFNELIENLTKHIDVIIILGNHDTFTHTDRLDTISGITDIKTYNNFFFLKYSGLYKYNNIDFVVSSLFDNQFIKNKDLEEKNKDTFRIALFHGMVSGSKLNNKITETGCNVKIKDFEGFDKVLLGDIHKHQYITKDIAYPGSLIQQNHGEEIEHGIIKWDLVNDTSEFVKIKNDYSFITVVVNENNEITNNPVFTKKSRIRLLHKNTNNIDTFTIKKLISSKTEILSLQKEFIFEKENSFTEKNKNQYESRQEKETATFLELIKEYPDEIKNELKELHNSLNNYENNSKNTTTTTNSWIIESIEFKNVFIYGGNIINKVNFKKGITGILGTNATGKSSFMNIILFCLFGNASFNSKHTSNRNIINKKSTHFHIKMVIEMNNTKYIIEREGKHKKRKGTEQGMTETVSFFQEKDNILVNLTDTDKQETVRKFQEVLGLTNKDNFILTNFMSYSQCNSLLNMTNSCMSKTFGELFNLEKYKDIYSKVLKLYKENNDNMNILSGKISVLEEKKDDISNSNSNILEKIEFLKNKIKNNNEKDKPQKELNFDYSKDYLISSLENLEKSATDSSIFELPVKLQKELLLFLGINTTKVKNSTTQKEIYDDILELGKLTEIANQETISKKMLFELQDDLKIKKQKEYIYKIYKGIMNDKCLPKIILRDTISQIEKFCNRIIYKIIGITINIGGSSETVWEITLNKDNIILGVEMISGFERFVVNVFLKLAMDKYKFYSASNIFCIDEVMDCVSMNNYDKIDDIFQFLKSHYHTILVVSHNEELKNKIDSRINIHYDLGNGSKIQ